MQNSIHLMCQDGHSDKVYDVAIEEKLSGYVVNFAYGRRGSSLNVGTKTNEPVDLLSAQKIFNKLVKEKTAKGYIESGSTKSFVTAIAKKPTGIKCQLLNTIDETETLRLLNDDTYIAQEKKDGVRATVLKTNTELVVGNKEGFSVGFSDSFQELLRVPVDFIIDCESINDTLFIFDLIQDGKTNLQRTPLTKRLAALEELFNSHLADIECVKLVETAIGTAAKKEMYQRLLDTNAEGIVFKKLDGFYVSGRPTSGGDQLKRKFYETDFFIVEDVNSKRSIKLSLLDQEQKLVPAGNVTIPANYEIPKKGDVVKVKYLYAFPESGSVYQPIYLGAQRNVDLAECTTAQLKYKPEVVS